MATEKAVMAVIRAARPSFRTIHDKAAFAVHAAFLAAGYVLHATGPPAFADDVLSSTSTADEVGMDNWTEIEENYAFVYSNPEKSSKKVLMKCLAMNDSLIVDVLKEGDSEPLHLEFDAPEYVESNGGTTYGSQFKNLGKLVADVNKEILDKLDRSSGASSSSQTSRSKTSLRDDRDEWGEGVYAPEVSYISPPSSGFIAPPIPGFGGSDVFPGAGTGIYPTRGGFSDGGMLVGPNDPMFFGGGIGRSGLPGGRQGVPPGARFDPYGPPGVPGFEPDRFARNPRRPGGGMHPDLEQFPDGMGFMPGGGMHPDFEEFADGSGFMPGGGRHPDLDPFPDGSDFMSGGGRHPDLDPFSGGPGFAHF